MNIKQKTGLAVGAAVIGVGAALGVGYAVAGTGERAQPQAGQPADGTVPGGENGGGPGGRNGRGGMGNLAASLAEKLGLDQSAVAEALQEAARANRPDGDGQGRGTPPSAGAQPGGSGQDRSGRDATLAKALAEKLGVDEAKVTAALAEIRSEQRANRPDDGGNAPDPQPSATA